MRVRSRGLGLRVGQKIRAEGWGRRMGRRIKAEDLGGEMEQMTGAGQPIFNH